MPLNPPAFSPPAWPRLGRAQATGQVIPVAPAPVEIPVCWLTGRVRLRMGEPITTAAVTQSNVGANVGTAYDQDDDALTEFGDFPFTATLETVCSQDAKVLAHWAVTYRNEPRTYSPELTLDLMHRTDDERARILRIERFQRIKIVGVPPEYPEGAADLIVSGITQEIGVFRRRVRWATRPVIGLTPGVSGPWFRLGYSSLDGTDHLLF